MLKRYFFRAVIPLAILACGMILPTYGVGFDVSTFLTVVSLLFAILLGFFIAAATSNFMGFQASLGNEEGALQMIFNLGVLVQPSAKERLADAIDRYLIATFDYDLTDYVTKTQAEFSDLLQAVDGLEPEGDDKRSVAALAQLQRIKDNLLRARKGVEFAAPRVTTGIHWAVILILAGILTFLLFAIRDGDLLTGAIVGIFVASLYLILLLLHEVDNNTFLQESLAYTDAQGVFRAIGRLNYYPQHAIADRIVRPEEPEYRVGVYGNYPASTEKTIKVVSRASAS